MHRRVLRPPALVNHFQGALAFLFLIIGYKGLALSGAQLNRVHE